MALLKIFANEIFWFFLNWHGWVVFYEQENFFHDHVIIMVTINVTINFLSLSPYECAIKQKKFYLQEKEATPSHR